MKIINYTIIILVIFGFPFGVISIVCYFLCCMDSSDQIESDNEELSGTSLFSQKRKTSTLIYYTNKLKWTKIFL